ncbi:unnamed protein product [Heterobilharzia americana]|nr:unnamed protein product [Heterobilharzia americana]
MAEQFQDTCRSLMDYFAGAERVIHRLAALPTFDDDGDLEDETVGANANSPPTNLTNAIVAHQQTHTNLMNQADRVEAALQLGNRLLSQAHPAAVKRLRQWVNTIRTRWEELTSWSEQRGERLQQALEEQHKRKIQREELMEWIHAKINKLKTIPLSLPVSVSSSSTNLHSAKSKLDSDDSSHSRQSIDSKDLFPATQERVALSSTVSSIPLPSGSNVGNIDLKQTESIVDSTLIINEITEASVIEKLLSLHSQLEEEVKQKQPIYEDIIKHAKRRTPVKSSNTPSIRRGRQSMRPSGTSLSRTSNTANQQQHSPSVSIFTSSNINQLYSSWRELWLAMLARKSHLNERLAYLNEVEKMKDFQFESWRQRYVSWLSANKARVIDLFHRKDRDRDGRLTRAEFIDGIIEMKFQTTRVEMETVADIFDANGDGYIDYRECLNALRANYMSLDRASSSNTTGGSSLSLNRFGPSDEETINDELRRQVGLCTCHNTYKIRKMATNKYRFGDSQKLCLVRILRSAVMVRVGGGWVALDEFLVKNDPCRDACERLTSIADLAKAAGVGRSSYWLSPSALPLHPTSYSSTSIATKNPPNRADLSSHSHARNHSGSVQIVVVVSLEAPVHSNNSRSRSVNKRSRYDSHNLYQLMMNGPGQDNAFYLVMPNTKPNPANHNSCGVKTNTLKNRNQSSMLTYQQFPPSIQKTTFVFFKDVSSSFHILFKNVVFPNPSVGYDSSYFHKLQQNYPHTSTHTETDIYGSFDYLVDCDQLEDASAASFIGKETGLSLFTYSIEICIHV